MPDQPFLNRISRKRIDPPAVTHATALPDLIDSAFLSYNAGRLREACQTFVTKMLAGDGTVGLSLSGALTPAGLGMSCLVPLIEAGFIDWIVSTGANLYHDTHFALGMDLHQARPGLDDLALREHQVIRIYDIVFDLRKPARHRPLLPHALPRRSRSRGRWARPSFITWSASIWRPARRKSAVRAAALLAACHRHAVPMFTVSPGDSSIGMNLAALMLEGSKLRIDPLRDVNQTAAIVWDAKARRGSTSARPDPRRRLARRTSCLQTEPQIQEVLGLEESGHDYFLQFTDARPDTGGLSGATPRRR